VQKLVHLSTSFSASWRFEHSTSYPRRSPLIWIKDAEPTDLTDSGARIQTVAVSAGYGVEHSPLWLSRIQRALQQLQVSAVQESRALFATSYGFRHLSGHNRISPIRLIAQRVSSGSQTDAFR
jgi:hypothetical protein